jgi:hypothetical protein
MKDLWFYCLTKESAEVKSVKKFAEIGSFGATNEIQIETRVFVHKLF